MTDLPSTKSSRGKPSSEQTFTGLIAGKAARKSRALRSTQGVWFGLGMMGLIGWSVVVPTLLGTAFGIWLDTHHPGTHAWTLALLVGGLSIGCLNAWRWIANEQSAMHEEAEDNNE